LGEAAQDWRASIAAAPAIPLTAPPDSPAIPLRVDSRTDRTIEDVIERRRSNRHYAAEMAVSLEDFSTVLHAASSAPSLDVPFPPSDIYLIVNNVESLEPGSYYFDRATQSVHLLQSGDLRANAERLAMGQHYAADANVVAFGLADLEAIYRVYGDRGYRMALFEAALFGGRIQLAAHALGLGAVGSGSPDDEVTAFFSPHCTGKDYLFVEVFGVKRKPTAEENTESTRFLNRDRA
jgi:SagB-type dehydrogenase family enzyme